MKMSDGVETKGVNKCKLTSMCSLDLALDSLANSLIDPLKLEIEIQLDEDHLPASVKNKIYLIAREAITNIQAHAKATRAMITIHHLDNQIHMFIQDNGHHLASCDITKKLGLTRIQKHLIDLESTYGIAAHQSVGLAHWIHIPLPT